MCPSHVSYRFVYDYPYAYPNPYPYPYLTRPHAHDSLTHFYFFSRCSRSRTVLDASSW